MNAVVSTVPRGRNYIRSVITQAASKGAPEQYAVARWGSYHGASIAKDAVAAITGGEFGHESQEFFDVVRAGAIVGAIRGFRETPFHVRMLAATSGATGYWVSQGSPKPLSKPVLAGSTLEPLKITAIVAVTKESLLTGGELAEAALQRDLQRAVVALLDMTFIDAANSGIAGEMPASVTSGATPVVAGSDCGPAADVQGLIESFAGDLASAYLVTDPHTAGQLAFARDPAGALLFPDCGVRGGYVAGLPVIVSRSSPRDSSGGQIAMLDPGSIALGFDGIRITQSTHTSLLMADDPAGAAEMVSMFQSNSVAFLAEVGVNWKLMIPDAVSVLTGCDWAGCGS